MVYQSVCDTKVFYDTEFEATIAAAKYGWKIDADMRPYKCGSHWHITHVDRKKRFGHGHKAIKCPFCKVLFKKKELVLHKKICEKT